MDRYEMALKLMAAFPNSFIYHNGEFIAHRRSNTYLNFAKCETMEDLQCKVLEWLSRAAHKTAPYKTEKANKELHRFILDGINRFLGTEFDFCDMDLIYTHLGNEVNHTLTVEFVRSGYNMKVLWDHEIKEGLQCQD